MNKDMFLQFKNKRVKIVFDDNFILYGVVTQVYDDCIEFKTRNKTSLVRFQRIYEIVEIGEDRYDR